MSTVLWANLLADGVVTSDEADRYALYKHADKLDTLCSSLGLPPFHGLLDTTDLQYNTDDAAELPEGVTSTNEVMATGGVWMDAQEALAYLERLVGHIRTHKIRFGLLNNQHEAVVRELEEVIAFVRGTAPPRSRFNFSVVM
jgi:hypothetical protein